MGKLKDNLPRIKPEEIQFIRKAMGMSYNKLAEYMGVHVTTIHKWIQKNPSYPQPKHYRKLLDLYRKAIKETESLEKMREQRAVLLGNSELIERKIIHK